MKVHYRLVLPLATAAAAVLAAAVPAAAAIPDPVPIAPGQGYLPVVNGQSTTASVLVDCPNGVTGHPSRGQTLSVKPGDPAGTVPAGFTGSAGKAVDIGSGNPQNSAVQLRFYNQVAALPTTWVVPCSGTGLFTFTPDPNSPTALAVSVKVTFFNAA